MEDTNENVAPSVSSGDSVATNRDVEKQEEEKLKSKYPAGVGMKGPGGHSAFLQKRLQKGVSFFEFFLWDLFIRKPKTQCCDTEINHMFLLK